MGIQPLLRWPLPSIKICIMHFIFWAYSLSLYNTFYILGIYTWIAKICMETKSGIQMTTPTAQHDFTSWLQKLYWTKSGIQMVTKISVMRHNKWHGIVQFVFWLLPILFKGHIVFFFEYQKFVWKQNLVFRWLLRHLIMNLPTGYRSCIAQSLVFRWLQK